jgi:hypothetical protein
MCRSTALDLAIFDCSTCQYGHVTAPPAELVGSWREAAADLGVQIVAPYRLGPRAFAAWIPNFGSPSGTLIDWLTSRADWTAAAAEGYYVSRLNAESYRTYDRDLFVATLNDWGWHGQAPAPSWYTGDPWAE